MGYVVGRFKIYRKKVIENREKRHIGLFDCYLPPTQLYDSRFNYEKTYPCLYHLWLFLVQ